MLTRCSMAAISKLQGISVGNALQGGLIGALPAAICGIGIAVVRQNRIQPYGYDLEPVANFLLYLAALMEGVWAFGGALLALNQRFLVLVGGRTHCTRECPYECLWCSFFREAARIG